MKLAPGCCVLDVLMPESLQWLGNYSFNDIYTQAVQEYSVTVAWFDKRNPLTASPNQVAIYKVTLYDLAYARYALN